MLIYQEILKAAPSKPEWSFIIITAVVSLGVVLRWIIHRRDFDGLKSVAISLNIFNLMEIAVKGYVAL